MKSKTIIIILIIITGLCILGLSYKDFDKNSTPIIENNNEGESIIFNKEETKEEKVISFLEALEESNYEKLSKDFVPQLAEELTYDEMIKLKVLLDETWGDLINLNDPEYPDFGEDKIVLDYRNSQFEKESANILIRFIFNKDNKLTQVYFDSPKLKEATSN
ncbi:MAG: hypothetical protein MCSN_3850 [Candidatus Microsyncoccus archaeolyticus]|nr:MAG: hypothetical protein MCSN_3850 [Candidatus Parcubacteria bacterium]